MLTCLFRSHICLNFLVQFGWLHVYSFPSPTILQSCQPFSGSFQQWQHLKLLGFQNPLWSAPYLPYPRVHLCQHSAIHLLHHLESPGHTPLQHHQLLARQHPAAEWHPLSFGWPRLHLPYFCLDRLGYCDLILIQLKLFVQIQMQCDQVARINPGAPGYPGIWGKLPGPDFYDFARIFVI